MDSEGTQKDVLTVRHAAEWEKTGAALREAAEKLLEKGADLTKDEEYIAERLIETAFRLAVNTDTL